MHTRLISLIMLSITVLSIHIPAAAAPTGVITAVITNPRSNKGYMGCALYRGPDGFPSKPKKRFDKDNGKFKKNRAVCVFKNVPKGEYAIAVVHDENGNKKFDRNFMGIPKEGWGASGNPGFRLGPPRYKDCKFKFNGKAKVLSIRLNY